MAKIPTNSGKGWSKQEIKEMRTLIQGNTPTRIIGLKMGRTPAAIKNQASRGKMSLKPTNQSPYGAKKTGSALR